MAGEDPVVLRDPKYLDWVRRLPCSVCHPEVAIDPWAMLEDRKVSDPDHLPVLGLKGVGIKSPDAFTVPLCRKHHEQRGLYVRDPRWPLPYTDGFSRVKEFEGVNLYETVARLLWAYHGGVGR